MDGHTYIQTDGQTDIQTDVRMDLQSTPHTVNCKYVFLVTMQCMNIWYVDVTSVDQKSNVRVLSTFNTEFHKVYNFFTTKIEENK